MYHDLVFKLNNKPNNKVDNKTTLFILDKSEDNPNNMDLLTKICTAINLDFEKESTIYLNSKNDKTNIGPLLSGIKNVISFNVDFNEMNLNVSKLSKYFLYNFEEVTVLFSDSLQVISTVKEKKQSLWTCLQKQFKV